MAAAAEAASDFGDILLLAMLACVVALESRDGDADLLLRDAVAV